MRSHTITDQKEMEEIIGQCQWCHVAMTSTDGDPYVIPMNFGFRDGTIFIHGSRKGKKIDILEQHPSVCIHFSTGHQLRYQNEQVACSWSMKYRSILCYGKVEFLTSPEEKIDAMSLIMTKFTNREFKFNAPSIREVNVMRIKVERFEGRIYGY
ncbi:MAG: pyridoxamine 5'-phosphate oxidase family protein [Bacteroidales bacterium]|nr:pyridoxamine 5'-phosphate oxidase family protein [Bacteroidales bacterium]MDD4602250.1 pyridoxamine 5'-phosphate oxidase family protein [Bacteroidales bacterium]